MTGVQTCALPICEPSPPTQPKSQKRKRTSTTAKGTLRKNGSPKRTVQPLPKVPKSPPKRSYDKTAEELDKSVKEHTAQHFAKMKAAKVPKPQYPSTEEEVAKAWKMVENLNDPPKLTSDYQRQIEKATKRRTDDRLLMTTPPPLGSPARTTEEAVNPRPEGVFRDGADGGVVDPPDRGYGN